MSSNLINDSTLRKRRDLRGFFAAIDARVIGNPKQPWIVLKGNGLTEKAAVSKAFNDYFDKNKVITFANRMQIEEQKNGTRNTYSQEIITIEGDKASYNYERTVGNYQSHDIFIENIKLKILRPTFTRKSGNKWEAVISVGFPQELRAAVLI